MVDAEGNWPEWMTKAKEKIEEGAQWVVDNIIQPIKNAANNLKTDLENFDINNTEETVVMNSNYVSAYNGHIIIRAGKDFGLSFDVIILGRDNVANDLKHEYGHALQLEERGILGYTFDIALPSVTAFFLNELDKLPYDYFTSPWEREADILGGAKRFEREDPWTEEDGYFPELFKLFFE